MKLWNTVSNSSNKQKLDTISISELMGNNFYIPDYQRGYRWTAFEVKKMLEDFREYILSKRDGFYCLQPLVVFYNKDKQSWEVIDGQQRLTTLFLIFSAKRNTLKEEFPDLELFNLEYQSRLGSADFLNEIDLSKRNKNIDYFHFCNAHDVIGSFLRDNRLGISFIEEILNYGNDPQRPTIKFIWYDVTEEIENEKISSEEVFSRLNVGKIGLTNAELIKALFLNQVDKDIGKIKKENGEPLEQTMKERISIPLKNKIATEWDLLEQSLQDNDFWSFVYGEDDGKYDTRIEFLLDIVKNKDLNNSDEYPYYTFDKYVNSFKTNDEDVAKSAWKEITDLFYLLKNWYADKNIYHLVGFLRYLKVQIDEIRKLQDDIETLGYDDFISKLRKKIRNILKNELEEIDGLTYGTDNAKIRKILLLFNVITVLNCQKQEARFSFKDFYDLKMDLEHIRSQTPKDVSGDGRDNWIITTLQYFSGVDFDQCVFENKKNAKKIFEEKIKKCEDALSTEVITEGKTAWDVCKKLIELSHQRSDVTLSETYQFLKGKVFKESSQFSYEHRISNLVLLDSHTNRGYGNAFFPVKRRKICEQERNGVYIMPGTKNAFSKTYSTKLSDLMNWNNSDAEAYMEELKVCLSNI